MHPADPRKTCEDPRWSDRSALPVGGVPKRVLDVVLAVVALVILAPLLAVVALILLRSGGRPILTSDRLVGFRGRAFDGYRFRTSQGTLIGAVLERSGVAELPRLLNVLAGSMSFVGPRPASVEQSHKVNHSGSLTARPGLTGTWDVEQRAATETGTGVEAPASGDGADASRWALHRDLAILVNGTLRRPSREGHGTPHASGCAEQHPRTLSS